MLYWRPWHIERAMMKQCRAAGLSITTAVVGLLLSGAKAQAQERADDFGKPLPSYAKAIHGPTDPPVNRVMGPGNGLPNVMITGYWPPTNEMIRHFSNNAIQNPGGWVGENWEGRGYNIYGFFPEFPGGVLERGEGDFEVDYQDTSNDWWPLVGQLEPIGIVTFSRASSNHDWELEGGNRTYMMNNWTNDYLVPLKPTPELPIIIQEPPGTVRNSSQPMQKIMDAVNAQVPTLNSYISALDMGRFLSNFIGYHGNWYHFLHSDPQDPMWNICGGHIHIGFAMTIAEATQAAEVTLRVVTEHLTNNRFDLGDLNCDGRVDGEDIAPMIQAVLDLPSYEASYPACSEGRGDFTGDEAATDLDLDGFAAALISQP